MRTFAVVATLLTSVSVRPFAESLYAGLTVGAGTVRGCDCGLAVGCGPADVAGNYTVSITNGENQCNLNGWDPNGELTGVPVVVNTSLNTAGRPMVDDPRDALECFGSAPVDVLAIGPFVVRRSTAGAAGAGLIEELVA